MEKLVSAEKMRELENRIFEFGVDSFAVMEKAAMRITDVILSRFPTNTKVLSVCGRGNNGGDGIAAARMLSLKGYDVTIALPFGSPKTLDAAKNLDVAEKIGIKISSGDEDFSCYDLIIDALLGTGITSDVECNIPDKINKSGAFVLSADIPSGINSDTGQIMKSAVKADVTVAIGYKKYGHSIYPCKEYCGEIIVADIGIPYENADAFETDEGFVKTILPHVKNDAHKGDMGRISVVAGSKGFTGAATLCTEAALRSGCGLATLFTPENLNEIYEKKLTEAMTLPLKCNDSIDADEVIKNKDKILKSNAVIVGPGLGRDCDANKIIRFLFKNEIPAVIDADGINAVAENINILSGKKGPTVLTPHIGEFSRLTGLSADEILKNRLVEARKFATKYNIVLILKGAGSVVALPNGVCYVNHTGNRGMATGGSGDVLSGIVGALLASGIGAEKSAVAATYIHGLAGDFAAEKFGADSMLPTDMVNEIYSAFLKIKNQAG